MDLDEEELKETRKKPIGVLKQAQTNINVLGTKYKVKKSSFKEDKKLENVDGYTDHCLKLIVVESDFTDRGISDEKIEIYQNKVLRHEVIHAFLYESGLDCNSNKTQSWADNEEMVDWFAIQSPKILQVYKDLNIL